VVRAIAGPPIDRSLPSDATAADATGDRGCVVAQDHYFRLARWLGLYTMLLWVLSAAIIVFAALLLFFLLNAATSTADGAKVAGNIVGLVGAAAGGLVTGKAVGFVVTQRNTTSTELVASKGVVEQYCGSADPVAAGADAAMYKPLL